MEAEVLIKVENVSKKFAKSLKKSLFYGVQDVCYSITGRMQNKSLRNGEFWAVKDISFEVRRGECLGLIGHNGAGKSTLLKMLNGLISPDEGTIAIKGKIGALIELGAGFNPILTGRENIYNNAAIIGFTKKEIDEKLDEIIAFAELEEFIDMPVQNYSSGMKVRLGFAVAAQMEPDVLIIDEVLAVGDIGFRIKCMNKISQLLNKCAIIFVSHSMPQIARICTNGILLDRGNEILKTNSIGKLVEQYNNFFSDNYESNEINPFGIDIYNFKINNVGIKDSYQFIVKKDEEIDLSFTFRCPTEIKEFSIHLPITNEQMNHIALSSSLTNLGVSLNRSGDINVRCRIPNSFTNGKFYVGITIVEVFRGINHFNLGNTLYKKENCFKFFVNDSPLTTSVPILLNSNFSIE